MTADKTLLSPLGAADPMVEQAAARAFAALAGAWAQAPADDAAARLAVRETALARVDELGFAEALPALDDVEAWPDAAALLRAQAGQGAPVDLAFLLVLLDRRAAVATDPGSAAAAPLLTIADGATRDAFALARCLQLSAAMAAALDLSVQYVQDRKQFGRALAQFQAIQHSLAIAAEECAAATAATDFALAARCQAAVQPDRLSLLIDAAVIVCDQAVDIVYDITHQVHGAIGFTREYALHRHSLNLLHWRQDLMLSRQGSTGAAERLGDAVIAQGGLWPGVTHLMNLTDR